MSSTLEPNAFVDATRALVANAIAPHVAAWETAGQGAPDALYATLGELGYHGLLVPIEYGGSALDTVTYARVTEELAAGDCGIANAVNVTNSPIAAAIRDHGTRAQCAHYLPALARGARRGCFMLSEAEAGSDAAAIRTRAVKTAQGWRLDGAKRFVTAGARADFALVVAVTEPSLGKRGISTFLAPRSAWTVTRLEDKLGQRNCDTAECVFDGAEIGDDALLGAAGDGYRIALAYLNTGRIGVAAQAVGVARAAFEAAAAYARERRTFGVPIVEHQAVGFRLAEMAEKLGAARALTLRAAALADAGQPAIVEASMAKAFATDMAEHVTSAALQVFGGAGYTRDCAVEKLYRDARVLSIYEGSNDIQRLVVARAIAGGWSALP
ncbi:MAG: acyl-CoA dehydrogenase family protein [Gammaproteobacteria bacterium]